MTLKNRTTFALAITIFLTNTTVVLLSGCANNYVVDTPVFDKRPQAGKIMLEYPPTRLIYYGSITPESKNFVIDCMTEMHKNTKNDKHNYVFNKSFKTVHSVDMKKMEEEIDTNNLSIAKKGRK